MSALRGKTTTREAEATLRHWLEAVPNDRLAHLVRDAARGLSLPWPNFYPYFFAQC